MVEAGHRPASFFSFQKSQAYFLPAPPPSVTGDGSPGLGVAGVRPGGGGGISTLVSEPWSIRVLANQIAPITATTTNVISNGLETDCCLL